MFVCLYINHTTKNTVEFLLYANVNIMINKPDKGQNKIKLYIIIQSI